MRPTYTDAVSHDDLHSLQQRLSRSEARDERESAAGTRRRSRTRKVLIAMGVIVALVVVSVAGSSATSN